MSDNLSQPIRDLQEAMREHHAALDELRTEIRLAEAETLKRRRAA